jgi:hypothetical protein
MAEAQLISAKYIFLDIVGYSVGRSVEAQTEIISILNELVRRSVKQFNPPEDQIIYLPTGDGICIALLAVESPYDVHIQIPLEILRGLDEYNRSTADEMRKFQVRIGVNANVDNVVTDVNGRRNVSGAGINMAQRVMNFGNGNQLLVGESVFETLRHREKYMSSFTSFTATAKHGIQLRIHQMVQSFPGLNISVPSEFKPKEVVELRLTKLAAYYIAHAAKNVEFLRMALRSHGDAQGSYSCTVLLYMLAYDSANAASVSDPRPYRPHTWGGGKATLDQQFEYYNSVDFWVICDFSGFIESEYLADFLRYFEPSGLLRRHFVTQEGLEKLRTDWPTIWKEFGFQSAAQVRGRQSA